MSQWFLLLALSLMPLVMQAQQYADEVSPRYLAQIEVHSFNELSQLLLRSEQLFDSGKFMPSSDTPIAFVLHGPEAQALMNGNYRENKSLVDLAARLSAFKVVDIKVCKTWMGGEGLDERQLPPFIDTVPFGPAEERRLVQEEGYVYF